MSPSDLIKTAETIVVIAAMLAIGYSVFKSRTTASTLTELKALVDVQKDALEELRIQRKDDLGLIAKLQGQVEVLQSIPLQNIEKTLAVIQEQDSEQTKVLKQISDTQNKMLTKLR